MKGERFKQCRVGLGALLESLNRDDSFEIYAFNHKVREIVSRSNKATAHYARALLEEHEREVGGGTAFYDAMIHVLGVVRQRGTPRDRRAKLLFLTDGEDEDSKHGWQEAAGAIRRPGCVVDVRVLTVDASPGLLRNLENIRGNVGHFRVQQIQDVAQIAATFRDSVNAWVQRK